MTETTQDLSSNNRFKWPFQRVLNARGQPTRWVLLHGPIVTHKQQEQFAHLRCAGYRFAGMSSYINFPQAEPSAISGGVQWDRLDYEMVCEAWCHCFREPHKFLHTDIPRALISASDFTDYLRVSPEVFAQGERQEMEFLYVGSTEEWKRQVKNWNLAGQCIPRICRDFGLKALVIGAPDPQFPANSAICFSAPLAWNEFLTRLSYASFLFVPNVWDASPRLMTEALCLNVPLVVNAEIVGGWKYVNRFTGVFFDNQQDVRSAVNYCLQQSFSPRDWFRTNHGPYIAGRQLLRLLRTADPEINESSHLCLEVLSEA